MPMKLNRTLAALGLAALAGITIAQETVDTPAAPAADAEQLLAGALVQAGKEGKVVFLTTHASW